MKTTPVLPEDLSRSVIAVPPLARTESLAIFELANRRLMDHLLAGGISTVLYGGNANLHNVRIGEYEDILDGIAAWGRGETWVIPSAGPDWGKSMDQAAILARKAFPATMLLPPGGPTDPGGFVRGVRDFVATSGHPAILYLKDPSVLPPDAVARLIDGGEVVAIKYGVSHPVPDEDPYLAALVQEVDRRRIVSGMGERPAIGHFRAHDLASFTSGAVCLAPRVALRLLAAMRVHNFEEARLIRARILPLEDLRDAIHPIRVLHDAVSLSGIADMGRLSPYLSNLDEAEKPAVAAAAKALYDYDTDLATMGDAAD